MSWGLPGGWTQMACFGESEIQHREQRSPQTTPPPPPPPSLETFPFPPPPPPPPAVWSWAVTAPPPSLRALPPPARPRVSTTERREGRSPKCGLQDLGG